VGPVRVIEYGKKDQQGRSISLREIGDDWRQVADIAPKDEQRPFVPALAARYLLLSDRDGVWKSFAVYADDRVVGHIMWAKDTDGSYWLGGLVVDQSEQGLGVGRITVETLVAWLFAKPDCHMVRLSYHPANSGAAHLYSGLGFAPSGAMEGDEIVVERATR